jgi:hypothetical protein
VWVGLPPPFAGTPPPSRRTWPGWRLRVGAPQFPRTPAAPEPARVPRQSRGARGPVCMPCGPVPNGQEEHRRSSTCLAVTSRPTIDLGTLPRQPARIPPRFDLDNGCDAGNLLDWIHSSTMVRSAMAGRGSKGIRAADFRPFSHESHGRTGRRSNRNPSAAPNVWIVRRGARSCITQPRSSTVVFDAEREAPADSLLARSGM